MNDTLQFATRGEFRAWLEDHCLSEEGIWLVLGKAGGPKTIKAGEALEEALCFGWIDGQMQSLDDKTYRKYFSQRRGKSKWLEKNKQLVQMLEEQGRMTDSGRKKIAEAKAGTDDGTRRNRRRSPRNKLRRFPPFWKLIPKLIPTSWRCPCRLKKHIPALSWILKPKPGGLSASPGSLTG